MHPVPRQQAELPQAGADLQDHGVILMVGHERIIRELVVGPFLLDLGGLAVDDLGHHPLLPVGADQVAAADGGLIGVALGAPLEQVEGGVDVRGGAVDEGVLCLGMAARDGFAGDWLVARCFDREGRFLHLAQRRRPRGVRHAAQLLRRRAGWGFRGAATEQTTDWEDGRT